jgi:hypothetical protein
VIAGGGLGEKRDRIQKGSRSDDLDRGCATVDADKRPSGHERGRRVGDVPDRDRHVVKR